MWYGVVWYVWMDRPAALPKATDKTAVGLEKHVQGANFRMGVHKNEYKLQGQACRGKALLAGSR